MENNIDEVKVLQTAALLLTTNTLVKGESLSKVRNTKKIMIHGRMK